MANYVLVHGGNVSTDTWNNLTNSHDYPAGGQLGGQCWKYTVSCLEEQGHRVFAPDLKDENIYNLSDHIEQICSLISDEDLEDVILVGHSYGGMVITGVAAAIPERIKVVVYLDAAFPDPGQSLFDILALAGFDAQEVVDGTPSAYTEKLFFNPDKLTSLSKVYILCTESVFSPVTAIVTQKIDFNNRDWSYYELPTNHFAQATMPGELNKILMDLSDLNN